jgi:hypothetical protein
MSKLKPFFFFTLVLFFLNSSVSAEIFPKENQIINKIPVYFEEELSILGESHLLMITTDSLKFTTDSVTTYKNNLPTFWVSDLKWGHTYYWRVIALDKNKKELKRSAWHTFYTIAEFNSKYINEIKIVVHKNDTNRNNKGFVSCDYARTIFDRKGKAVWILPNIKGLVDESSQIRDLKVTQDNTITFLIENSVPLEIDMSGEVLWKAPYPLVINNDTIQYHHDFKKTKRGTYMVLGNKKVYKRIPVEYKKENLENEYGVKMIDNYPFKLAEIGLVLEFNSAGDIIWRWDAEDYIDEKDYNYYKTPSGFPNMSTHMNAFGESDNGLKIYVGFRDLSRIIKIDKKTNTVELAYGEKFPSGQATLANNLFRNQHDANPSSKNSIYIFNNNGSRGGGTSSVLELRDNLKYDTMPVWKFELDFDSLSSGKSLRGGNVQELPNKNLLVCAGQLNRIFEVTKSKKIVWDAFVMSRGYKDTLWQAFPQYRAGWLKNLDECHFLIYNVNSGLKNKSTFNFRIINSGNTKDSYIINVYSTEKKLIKTYKTKQLEKNAFIDFSAKIPDGEVFETIKIISQSDPRINKWIN